VTYFCRMNFELLNSRLGKIPLEIRDSLAAIVWLQFRATQSQENITLIGDVLRLRGLTITDFVSAWLATGDRRMAVHLLWRTPEFTRQRLDEVVNSKPYLPTLIQAMKKTEVKTTPIMKHNHHPKKQAGSARCARRCITGQPAAKAARVACQRRTRRFRSRKHSLAVTKWVETHFEIAVGVGVVNGCPDPADSVQRGILKGERTFRAGGCSLKAWLWIKVVSTIKDDARKSIKRPDSFPIDEVLADTLPAKTEPDSYRSERLLCIRTIFNRLPPQLLKPLLRQFGSRVPQKKLAGSMKLSLGALKMQQSRARRAVAAMLRAAGCHCSEDVLDLGDRALLRPVSLPWPRAARQHRRPTCQPPSGETL
jgi:DNA-directed RNA polymerase specialized sigma24 family protein